MNIRASVIIGVLLVPIAACAATVQTVDDRNLNGTLTSFDGHNLIVTITENGQARPTTVPVEDITRVVLKDIRPQPAPVPPPEISSSDQPAAPNTRVRRVIRKPTTNAAPAPAPVPTPEVTVPPPPVITPPPASRSAMSPNWRLKLVNGDKLHGLVSWTDQRLIVRPDAAVQSDPALPAKAMDWIWHGDAAQQAKAEAMQVPRGNDDVAFVRKEKENEIVAVHGTALGIDGDELAFRFDGEDRKIGLSKLVGIVFAEQKLTVNDAFYQCVRLADGEQLSGQWKTLDGNTITLASLWGDTVSFPISAVAEITCRNGRAVYVSDLKPAKVEQTPYFDRVIPYRTDASLSGGLLRLSDGTYDKGIAVHSRCVLDYDLGGRFDRFKTKLGFEPGAGAMGRAAVRVLADGKVLFENPDARGDDKPVPIAVDVTGANRLTLEVDFGQGQDVGDRVVWAEARLTRARVGGQP